MDDIRGLLNLATATFDRLRIAYFVTGSAASIMYGKYRTTNDIDLVAALGVHHVPGLCAAFPAPEFHLSENAISDAIQRHSMFNILHEETGYKIDVVVPQFTAYVELQFDRAQPLSAGAEHEPMFISPEDLIISKMRFFQEGASDKHLTDIAGIVEVQPALARHYIEHWAQHFGLLDIWRTILKRVEQAP